MWQHLTSTSASTVPAMTRAWFNFASISSGPGNESSSNSPTSLTIETRDREFVESASYKGCTYRVDDHVHLINPDDTSKPIVGLIYKVFVLPG